MYDRQGNPVMVTVPSAASDFPITIDTLGRTYYRTGKLGTFTKTGEETAEYEEDDGDRLWANVSGVVVELHS